MNNLFLVFAFLFQDDVEKYFSKLEDEYLEEREKAKKELIKIGDPAKKKVISGLDHADYRVVIACVEILIAWGDSSQVKKIGEFAVKEKEEVYLKTFLTYLKNNAKVSEEYLVELLGNPSQEIIMECLVKLKELKSKKACAKAYEIYKKSSDQNLKNEAFNLVVSLGVDAKEYLVEFVKADEPDKRAKAIQGLYDVDTDEVIRKIGTLAKTETDQQVVTSIFTYLKKRVEKANPYLKDCLSSSNVLTRKMAIETLFETKNSILLPETGKAYESEKDEQLRVKFMEYFAMFPDKAQELILKGVEDKNIHVRKIATAALGGIKDESVRDKLIKIFKESEELEIRIAAFTALTENPQKALDVIIGAVGDKAVEIKRMSIVILGRMRAEGAVDALIQSLDDKDLAIVELAKDSLARIGDKAIEKLKKDANKEEVTRQITLLYKREKLENILSKFITKKGTTGYFDNQLSSIDTTSDVLIAVISSQLPRTDVGSNFPNELRELAIRTLVKFKEKKVLDLLKSLWEDNNADDSVKYAALVTLFHLGENEYFEKNLEKLVSEADDLLKNGRKEESASKFVISAMLYNRANFLEKALALYKKVEESGSYSQPEVLLYNLACLYSKKGVGAKSVEYLEKAVKAGFKDKEWILLDKELDNIRKEESYKKLLANESLFKSE